MLIILKCMWTFSMYIIILGHKTNLHKFKETEIIPSIFSDHNEMKLEISNRKLKTSQIQGN